MTGIERRPVGDAAVTGGEAGAIPAAFRVPFHNAPMGMAVVGADGRYRSANPALCGILGRTEAEVVGAAALDFCHPDDASEARAAFERVLAQEAPASAGEERWLRPDGSVVSVRVALAGAPGRDGRPMALFLQVADLTRLRTAEAALRASEERYRALVRYASDAILMVDPDGTITYASPAVERLLGYRPEEAIGRNALDFVHPGDHARVAQDLAFRLTEPEIGEAADYRVLHQDGSWREAEVVGASYVDDPEGQALVVTVRDVTERKRYQEQLAASEARFKALVQTSWDMITLHGPDGRIRYASPAAEVVLGYSEDEMNGLDPFPLIHEDDLPEVLAAFGRLAADRPFDDEPVQFRIRHRDGSWRWLESGGINRLADPAVEGVVLTSRDVTDKRAVAEALARRAAQQTVVARVGHRALREASLDRLFAAAVGDVAGALGVEHVALFELWGDDTLRVVAEHGPVLSPDHHPVWADGRAVSLSGHALIEARPVAVDDYGEERVLAVEPAAVAAGMRSGAVVVVDSGAGPFGVLAADAVRPRAFAPDDIAFMQAVANVLAAAVERSRGQEEVRRQALRDALTGLPNRSLLLDRLELALHRLGRHPGSVAVLFVDVDHLKVINDSLGHGTGDVVVRAVADRLTRTVRPEDTVARFGGDEFVVVCEDTDAEGAAALARRISDAISEPVTALGRSVVVTASVGITVTGDHATTGSDMLSSADAAMYAAKAAGRARHRVFDTAMRQRVTSRLEVETGLREALAGGQLRLHYQPIVEWGTGRWRAVEALVRWEHPERGLLSPADFIGVAEETGLVVPLGAWVIGEALRNHARWCAGGWEPMMSINLSPRQLTDPGLVDLVDTALRDTGIAPAQVAFEITEHAVIDDIDQAATAVDALRGLGVNVGMDDFGTGYSSLSLLRRLAIQFVKIDRSFVAGLGRSLSEATVFAAVVSLAKALGLAPVAEGVETAEQLELVGSLGCSYAQGYLLGAPLPPEDVLAVSGVAAADPA